MATKRVLIVNNAADRGKSLAFALGTLAADLQVGILPSAEEAFLTVMQSNVDLVVVDLNQPGKDSLDLVTIIHTRIPTTRIVMIVDPADAPLKEQAASAGVTAFFSRPADKNEFLKAAAYCLGMPAPTTPLTPPKPSASEATSHQLAERLTDLLKSLGAAGSAVYDRHGKRLAVAGTPPEELVQPKALPGLLSALAASQKAGLQLGQASPDLVLTLKGIHHHLLVAPLSGVGMVLVCLKAERSSLRLALALEELFQARLDLEQRLGKGPAPQPVMEPQPTPEPVEAIPEPSPVVLVQPPESPARPSRPAHSAVPEAVPAELPAEADDPALAQKLSILLQAAADRKLQAADVDAFWNDVATAKPEAGASADLLSYDQARNMGLTPKEGGR
jgi:DNA-binding NarL/FixJ family response regulator